jgi:MYXO-CTERM domain-containing protein
MGFTARFYLAKASAALGVFASLAAPPLSASSWAAPGVWVADATKKVRPTDPTGSAREARLFASRNEFESFQAVVVGPATGVSAQMSELAGPSSIRSVTLFREALINLANPSSTDGAAGRFPDALVPDVDDVVGEKRNAFPFDVPAGENRAIWIEVLVPADAPPGDYHATLAVHSNQGDAQVPVTLTVWDFALPSTSSLHSHFGLSYPTLPAGHGVTGAEFTRLRGRYSQLGLDHRISLGGFDDGDPSAAHVEAAYGAYLDGTAPTRLTGARLTSVMRSGGGFADWVARFKAHGWLERLFDYTCDEPPQLCAWSDIPARAAAARAADPSFRTLVTTSIWEANQNGVTSSIDLIVPVVNFMWDKPGQPHAGNQAALYASFLAGNPRRELWIYQSCMSHGCGGSSDYYTGWPSIMIDASAARARAEEWLTFLLGATGELYWETTAAFSHDAWNNQWDFTGNGDGTLFYPGTPAKIGGSTHIPVASIRLKMIREGMEDYEYLKRVSDLGDPAFARQVASALFPNAYTTDAAPADILAARKRLAQRILELSRGTPPPPSTCSDGTEADQCSATRPLSCRAGVLEAACAACGCPEGKICQGDGRCGATPSPNSVFDVQWLASPPSLDGRLGDWEALGHLGVAGASVKAGWDAQALYLAFDVPDDRLVAAPAGGGDVLWDGDGVEVMLSASSPRGASAGPLDFHFLVGVDGRVSSARAWADFPNSGATAAVDLVGASLGLGIASGYRVELEVPWAPLGVTPAAGLTFGFDVAVNDKDDPSGATTSHDWAGLTRFNNPAGWGTLTLGPATPPDLPDAGADPSPSRDAGAAADSGPSDLGASKIVPWAKGSCGCSAEGGSALGPAILALGVLALRRAGRRRRCARTSRGTLGPVRLDPGPRAAPDAALLGERGAARWKASLRQLVGRLAPPMERCQGFVSRKGGRVALTAIRQRMKMAQVLRRRAVRCPAVVVEQAPFRSAEQRWDEALRDQTKDRCALARNRDWDPESAVRASAAENHDDAHRARTRAQSPVDDMGRQVHQRPARVLHQVPDPGADRHRQDFQVKGST